ncbi:hypothetical protein PIB30_113566, partial [Stylosanthes scabra]|nr:hypothetical protein [Stylosanthes scabra]
KPDMMAPSPQTVGSHTPFVMLTSLRISHPTICVAQIFPDRTGPQFQPVSSVLLLQHDHHGGSPRCSKPDMMAPSPRTVGSHTPFVMLTSLRISHPTICVAQIFPDRTGPQFQPVSSVLLL